NKAHIFGTWFASLDIRQDSRIHTAVLHDINTTLLAQQHQPILPFNYDTLAETEKIKSLLECQNVITVGNTSSTIAKDTIESIFAINH
ncbi:phosphoenolpyruvate carboxylase, partial [Acinetobacter baumannii]